MLEAAFCGRHRPSERDGGAGGYHPLPAEEKEPLTVRSVASYALSLVALLFLWGLVLTPLWR
jgi:hypothetical protein